MSIGEFNEYIQLYNKEIESKPSPGSDPEEHADDIKMAGNSLPRTAFR